MVFFFQLLVTIMLCLDVKFIVCFFSARPLSHKSFLFRKKSRKSLVDLSSV